MASHLGMAPSSFSEVLKGRTGLSLQAAARIARKLGLSEDESEYFALLVQYEAARTPDLRDNLLKRLRQVHPATDAHDVSVDAFQMMAEWYHVPLLMMTDLPGGMGDAAVAAERLGITELEATAAIERLERLELLERSPATVKWQRKKSRLLAQSKISNVALQAFHRQMLALATQSLENQSPAEKVVGSETFAFDPKDLPEAQRVIDQMFNRLVKLAGSGQNRDSIYHVGVQLFRLTEAKPRRKRS